MPEQPRTVREAWTSWITPDDYDSHMNGNGQAAAAAALVARFLSSMPRVARLWFAGAGTGQLLELLPSDALARTVVTATDVNAAYLRRFEARARRRGCGAVHLVVDDLERSSIAAPFDAAIAVLVLEHVAVLPALRSLLRVRPRRVLVVMQRNPEGEPRALVPGQKPVGTVAVLQAVRPHLVKRNDVLSLMRGFGYGLEREDERPVADGKALVGLAFGVEERRG